MRAASSFICGLLLLWPVADCRTYVDHMGEDDDAANPGDDDGADDDAAGDDDTVGDVDQDGDGFTEAQGDCDDGDATVYPGAPDLCDGIVNDCDAVLQPHSEDGIVSFVDAAGHATVLTEVFDGGSPGGVVEYTLDEDGTLTFCEGVFYVRLTVVSETAALVGRSNGPLPATLDAAGTGSVVRHTAPAGALALEGLRISGGVAQEGGGVYSAQGTIELASCDLRDNAADFRGAGIYLAAGDLVLDGCTLADNDVLEIYDGGAGVHLGSGSLVISNSTFTDNTATHGAAIEVVGELVVTDTRFEGNRAMTADGGLGGAIRSEGPTVTIRGSHFEQNEAGLGGAIWAWDADVVIEDSVLQYNAAETGGALYLDHADLTCVGDTAGIFGFFGNVATGYGGAVYSNATVVSQVCDWGFMADSNLPQDIVVDETVFADYDDDATFTCTTQGCTPP